MPKPPTPHAPRPTPQPSAPTGPRRRLAEGRRRNLYIPDEMWEALSRAADEAGITSSEWIRRAIDERLPKR